MSARVYARVFVALLAGVVMLTATTQAQTTWYVDDDAPNDPGPGDPTISDPNEDGSPAHPFDEIQEDIYCCEDGDKVQGGTTTILKFSYQDSLEEDFQRRQYASATRDALTESAQQRQRGAAPSEARG